MDSPPRAFNSIGSDLISIHRIGGFEIGKQREVGKSYDGDDGERDGREDERYEEEERQSGDPEKERKREREREKASTE